MAASAPRKPGGRRPSFFFSTCYCRGRNGSDRESPIPLNDPFKTPAWWLLVIVRNCASWLLRCLWLIGKRWGRDMFKGSDILNPLKDPGFVLDLFIRGAHIGDIILMTNADGDLMRFKPTKMVIQWDNDQQKWWFNGYYNQLKHTVPLKHIRATNRVEASHTSWDLGHLVLPSKLPYWSEFMFERSIHGKLRVKFEKISDVVALDRDFVSQSGEDKIRPLKFSIIRSKTSDLSTCRT